MPDARGRFRGITVPELPWLREQPEPEPEPEPQPETPDWQELSRRTQDAFEAHAQGDPEPIREILREARARRPLG